MGGGGAADRDAGHLMTSMRGDWLTGANGGTLCEHAHQRRCQSAAQISRVRNPSALLQHNFGGGGSGALIEVPAD